jgi:hypothetical protein
MEGETMDDLPGMWDHADLAGGWADTEDNTVLEAAGDDSRRQRRIDQAQATLERCGGDLGEAITYAAFRRALVPVLAESWPETLRNALGLRSRP